MITHTHASSSADIWCQILIPSQVNLEIQAIGLVNGGKPPTGIGCTREYETSYLQNLSTKIKYERRLLSSVPSGLVDVLLEPGLDFVVGQKSHIAWMSDGQDLPVAQQSRPRLK